MGIERISILNYGEAGTGKSSSIATLFKEEQLKKTPDIQVCFLCTEANSLRGIKTGIKHHKIKLKENQLYYMIAKPEKPTTFEQQARDWEKNFVDKSYKEAAGVESSKAGRQPYKHFTNVIKGLGHYIGTDIYTGEQKDLGDITEWSSEKIFVIDSMTSIVSSIIIEVQGERQIANISDYNQVGLALMNKIVIPLTESVDCSIIMLGHTDILEDQNVVQPTTAQRQAGMLPTTKIGPRVYGNKSAWALPGRFTETIYSFLKDDNYYWATKGNKQIVSVRSFPRHEKLEQDYSKYEIFLPE